MKKSLNLFVCLMLVAILGMPAAVFAEQPRETQTTATVISKVNLNSASAEELQAIPGIGATLAERIISYRNDHGAFKTADELSAVRGIGEKSLTKILPWVTIK